MILYCRWCSCGHCSACAHTIVLVDRNAMTLDAVFHADNKLTIAATESTQLGALTVGGEALLSISGALRLHDLDNDFRGAVVLFACHGELG